MIRVEQAFIDVISQVNYAQETSFDTLLFQDVRHLDKTSFYASD